MTEDSGKLPESGSTGFYHHFFSNPVMTIDDKSALKRTTASVPDYSESFYGPNPPKMLCFGDYRNEADEASLICSEITAATYNTKQKNPLSQSDSSSASSGNNSAKSAPNSYRKRNGSGKTPASVSSEATGAPAANKKAKSEKPTGHAKPRSRPVRKEKIGERIATLQHLVSPFGKTDTASVLQETMSYIKFLHEQVQVLCSPYLQTNLVQGRGGAGGGGLKSRGLCLVPVSSTAHVESANGADIWSPAAAAAASINDDIGNINNGFNVAQNNN